MTARLSHRAALSVVAALLALFASPQGARAGCDNIPGEIDVFRAAQGAITAPFAVPGQTVQVRVRPQLCDASSAGLGQPPACIADSAVRVTVLYQPGAGAPRLSRH